MNLIEAIKSGKRFRLQGDKTWYPSRYFGIGISFLSYEPIIADDWEVEEEKIEITEEMLKRCLVPELFEILGVKGLYLSSVDVSKVFYKLKEMGK